MRRGHREREEAIGSARTTLIEALAYVDSGKLDEAVVGCALAMVFLAPVADLERAYEMAQQLRQKAEKREQLLARPAKD